MATSPHPKTINSTTIITKDDNVDTNSPPTSGTTFVQADPSNFRALVQKLTGASVDLSNHKLPVTYWSREARIPPRKLQERRQSRTKLKINLQSVPELGHPYSSSTKHVTSSSSPVQNRALMNNIDDGFCCGGEMEMSKASPLSTLDFMGAHGTMTSSRTPMGMEELEERVISEKGYYMHPSTPPRCRGSAPQLLPLFPLHHSSSST